LTFDVVKISLYREWTHLDDVIPSFQLWAISDGIK